MSSIIRFLRSPCSLAAALAAAIFLPAAEKPFDRVVADAIATSARQYEWMLARLPDDGKLPRSFDKGKLVTIPSRDWTSGFFPGSLWYLFEATGDAKFRAAAERYTALLEPEQHNRRTHDVGFMLYCSYGNGLRLTKNAAYRSILLNGAKSLVTRFNPKVNSLQSWDKRHGWDFPVIVDNMMNLELLLWADGEEPGQGFREFAVKHANTTLANHFRPDGSSVHVVDYDPATGAVERRVTHQGAANDSAWARGQAWGLYGFTVMYRATRDPRYLVQAEKIAGFLMNHPRMPEDKIPYWDFDAPGIPNVPRDSSSAAIMASALLELRRYAAPESARNYTAFARQQIRSLSSPEYLAKVGENGGFLLQHATGNHPQGGEIDVPINYGDYYFLEALLRARGER